MRTVLIVVLLIITLLAASVPSPFTEAVLSPIPIVLAQDTARSTFNGPCAVLTRENPRSPDCDAEIAANPLPDLETAVDYEPERDQEAHPRSVYLPTEPLAYPIAWQRRPWYFSDAPGVLPADDDWTNARLVGKYAMFYVYNAVQAPDRSIWYLIGPGQWMKDEFISVLQVPERPAGVSGPWVALDIRQATLVALNDDIPVFTTLMSAGYWLDTLEGVFQVYARTRSMEMKGPPGAAVPAYRFRTKWVMFFNEHEALHSADFHNYFGINRTHGCVNLAPGDAEWVWNFFDQTAEAWHPSGSSFFVDNREAAPWVYIYSSPLYPELPSW